MGGKNSTAPCECGPRDNTQTPNSHLPPYESYDSVLANGEFRVATMMWPDKCRVSGSLHLFVRVWKQQVHEEMQGAGACFIRLTSVLCKYTEGILPVVWKQQVHVEMQGAGACFIWLTSVLCKYTLSYELCSRSRYHTCSILCWGPWWPLWFNT